MADRMFGTNGVRGVVNEYLTSELALQMGKAIGTHTRGPVAIATDTRVSAEMIKSAVAAGIMAAGYDVIDLGVVPTPALQYFVKMRDSVYGGVMITASHNPPQFNGIKCIAEDGTESTRADEMRIEELYATEMKCVPWNKVGKMTSYGNAAEEYVDAVVDMVDAEKIRAAKLTVCLDCANGAACGTAPLLMKKLGVRAVTINSNPQGEFPGHLSEPTEDNLGDLIRMTKAIKADLGVAHDGDADRCIFVTQDGKYVSGDKSMALIAKHMLSKKQGYIVTPVSTSSMVEEVVAGVGGKIIYTAVGSPIVARKMMDVDAVFGGEENGGLIFPEFQLCRDGAMSAAVMLEYLAESKKPIGKMVSDLPVYHTEKVKIECPDGMKKKVMEHMAGLDPGVRADNTDGLKLLFDDGWVLARPSGTEPIFRIYSESKDGEKAKARAEKYEKAVRKFLGE